MLNPPRDYLDIIRLQSLSGDHTERYSSDSLLPINCRIDDFTVKNSRAMNHTVTSYRTCWTLKQPMKWTNKDVLDWIYDVVEEEKLDGSKFQGEHYRGFLGKDLCLMNREEFQQVDPIYGFKMFERFQNVCNPASPPNSSLCVGSIFESQIAQNFHETDDNNNVIPVELIHDDDFPESDECNLNGNHLRNRDLEVSQTDTDITVDIPNLGVYPITQEKDLLQKYYPCSSSYSPSLPHLPEFSPITPPPKSLHSLFDRQSTQKELLEYTEDLAKNPNDSQICNTIPVILIQPMWVNPSSIASSVHVTRTRPVQEHISETSLSSMSSLSTLSCSFDAYDQGYSSDESMSGSFMPPLDNEPPKEVFVNDIKELGINDVSKFGSPISMPCDTKSRTEHIKKKAKAGGLLLWMFVLDLLNDPNANPRLLKWEDRDHGVFRFVQSESVAKLWGQRKNNPAMTYEKFSRAMRFCRKAGYFESVPKTGQFPKKLCFMFGGKAHGWRH